MKHRNELLRKLSQAFMWTIERKCALGTMMKTSEKDGNSTSMNKEQKQSLNDKEKKMKSRKKKKRKMGMETMRKDTLEHQIIFFNLFHRWKDIFCCVLVNFFRLHEDDIQCKCWCDTFFINVSEMKHSVDTCQQTVSTNFVIILRIR